MFSYKHNKKLTEVSIPSSTPHSLPALAIYGIAQPSNTLYAIHPPNPSVSNAIASAAGLLGSSRAGSYGAFISRHNETNGKSSADAGKRTSG